MGREGEGETEKAGIGVPTVELLLNVRVHRPIIINVFHGSVPQ
jgi:hypothetical protein